jgi:hypothetical protein
MADQDSPSLYQRLGGVYSIATVMDDLVDRIMIDPRLNSNPRVDEAHHRVPPAGFKYLLTEMVCGATGGPVIQSGGTFDIFLARPCTTRKGAPTEAALRCCGRMAPNIPARRSRVAVFPAPGPLPWMATTTSGSPTSPVRRVGSHICAECAPRPVRPA